MGNVTLTIDDDLLRRARLRALNDGTSVNAVVREYLQSYAGSAAVTEARRRVVELSRASGSGSGPSGRTWSRDDIHER